MLIRDQKSTSIQTPNRSKAQSSRNKPRSMQGKFNETHSASQKFRKKRNHKRTSSRWSKKKRDSKDAQGNVEEYCRNYTKQMENDNEQSDYSENEFGSEQDKEEKCAIHSKDLDMVCLEVTCQIPVCSNCILIGNHKSHKYVEKQKFFKDLRSEGRSLVELQNEIDDVEHQLKMKGEDKSIMEMLNYKRDRIEKNIDDHYDKLVAEIEAKKVQTKREVTIYFEQMGEKLQHYITETVNVVNCNKEWRKKMRETLELVNSEEIDNGFLFMKQINSLQIKNNGERLVRNISELKGLVENKITECAKSFDVICNALNENVLVIDKQEVSFKQDLRERIHIRLEGNALEVINEQQTKDMMNAQFDPLMSNLMAGLDHTNMGTNNTGFNQESSFNNIGHNNFNMKRGPSKFNTRMMKSQFVNDDGNYYPQGNVSNVIPEEFINSGARSRSNKKPGIRNMNPSLLCKVFINILYSMLLFILCYSVLLFIFNLNNS